MEDVKSGPAGGRTWYMHDHYVICHWNDRAAEIVAELRAYEQSIPEIRASTDRIPIVVLLERGVDASMLEAVARQAAQRKNLQAQEIVRDIYFRPGNPASPESLEQVNADKARAVIVLADDRDGTTSDAHTLQCLLAMEHVVKKASARTSGETPPGLPSWPHVVAEIIEMNNYPKFSIFEEESQGAVEIIRGDSLRTRVLAQAARTPGLLDFYYDLLTHDPDSNELYEMAAAEVFLPGEENLEFPTVLCRVMERVLEQATRTTSAPSPTGGASGAAAVRRPEVIPIGVWRGNKVHLNPKPGSKGYEVRPDDSLVVIAYEPPGSFVKGGGR